MVLEVDLLGIAEDKKELQQQHMTPPLAVYGDGTVERLRFEKNYSTAPGAKARSLVMAALDKAEPHHSDVEFVLHAVVRPLPASRAGAKVEVEHVELAAGMLNLKEMLLESKKDASDVSLTLTAEGADDRQAEKALGRVRVDVEAMAALERVQKLTGKTLEFVQIDLLEQDKLLAVGF